MLFIVLLVLYLLGVGVNIWMVAPGIGNTLVRWLSGHTKGTIAVKVVLKGVVIVLLSWIGTFISLGIIGGIIDIGT